MRIEQQSIVKRYQVTDDGFIVGFVEARTQAEAEVMAQERYGVHTKIGYVFEINEPTEFLEDELGNRVFRTGACYRSEFIPIVRQTPQTQVFDEGIKVTTGMMEETFGQVGKIVDDWFLHHPGIHVIHFGATKDPETNSTGFLVVYYQMIELPTVHTIDELSGMAFLTEQQLREQRDFLVRLTTDLRTNSQLFEYAQLIGVEWNPAKHSVTERANCIQAIRRYHGWI